jgi:excinuclease UvrABC nuclease subunit
VFYRGARNLPGRYFGPFPSAGAVKDTLQSVQKIFPHPELPRHFFDNRSRPCLQHQIGRCSAPCVKLISREDYARDIAAAVKVLEGRNDEVHGELAAAMEKAAEALQYERAAALRDPVGALKQMQTQQIVTGRGRSRHRRVRRCGEPGEFAVIGDDHPRRTQSRFDQLFPEGRAGRTQRGAGFLSHAVLRETPPPARILVNLELAKPRR